MLAAVSSWFYGTEASPDDASTQRAPPGQRPIFNGPALPPALQTLAYMQGCPPGLEYLALVDSLRIHQVVDFIETVLPMEQKNKYKVMNSKGEQCYFAVEESGIFERHFGGNRRPFRIAIIDNFGRIVFYIDRPWSCCSDEVTVHLYNGSTLGRIQNDCGCLCNFKIFNETNDELFVMAGPKCGCNCGQANFDIYPVDSSTRIAQVRKEFAGLFKEFYTDADVFGVDFPIDLDVRMKAVFLGAVFLIDYAFYESKPHDPNNKSPNAGFNMSMSVEHKQTSLGQGHDHVTSSGFGFNTSGQRTIEMDHSHSIFRNDNSFGSFGKDTAYTSHDIGHSKNSFGFESYEGFGKQTF